MDDVQPDETIARVTAFQAICERFEEAFVDGAMPAIEDYLPCVSADEQAKLLEELVFVELELLQAPLPPDVSSYLERFPQHSDAILSAAEQYERDSGKKGRNAPCATISGGEVAESDSQQDFEIAAEVAERARVKPPSIRRFRLEKRLGKGAFGAVYLAEDLRLHRKVALKFPLRSSELSASELQRFFREGQAAAALRHPNICPVYELAQEDGQVYIAMAYIEGATLAKRIAEKRCELLEAVLLVEKLARALEYAHRKAVVHRDLKPSNIMFDAEHDEPVIMDFGLARYQEVDNTALTRNSVIMGTPEYMSPEQARGDANKVTGQSDVFSLGVILYELLTGEVPFQGRLIEILNQILSHEPTPPAEKNPNIDDALQSICLKAMAKDPAERFASMQEFADALQGWRQETNQDNRSIALPPPSSSLNLKGPVNGKVLAALVAVIAVVALIFVVKRLSTWYGGENNAASVTAPMTTKAIAEPNDPGMTSPVVDELEVRHFRHENNREVALGTLGTQTGRVQVGDDLRVLVRFQEPQYAMLIAVNTDGSVQLCLPEEEAAIPQATQELNLYENPNDYFTLTEGAGGQLFFVVASSQPLPSFQTWKERLQRDLVAITEPTSIWQFKNGQYLRTSLDAAGRPIDASISRGTKTRRNPPSQLQEALNVLQTLPDVETVEAILFPVVEPEANGGN
ncbi:serine/threonine-protein kinase [Blastopirellula sp. JC732]|uniref:non-specific serine/threonine protein kinase n=1 Tax=Blastopirellula sediminis TaxID=2894196 RepID=A0A9X1MJ96_9BACT|nr:serine/threonine-protein kinase [Blastopirellula sediminis]MCC9608245.1 serine/threonine-protein kinase [Blastopirellula sediminis]MCC9626962.1 serine/threonine-protein kinase [Blastopirellula sediminis]